MPVAVAVPKICQRQQFGKPFIGAAETDRVAVNSRQLIDSSDMRQLDKAVAAASDARGSKACCDLKEQSAVEAADDVQTAAVVELVECVETTSGGDPAAQCAEEGGATNGMRATEKDGDAACNAAAPRADTAVADENGAKSTDSVELDGEDSRQGHDGTDAEDETCRKDLVASDAGTNVKRAEMLDNVAAEVCALAEPVVIGVQEAAEADNLVESFANLELIKRSPIGSTATSWAANDRMHAFHKINLNFPLEFQKFNPPEPVVISDQYRACEQCIPDEFSQAAKCRRNNEPDNHLQTEFTNTLNKNTVNSAEFRQDLDCVAVDSFGESLLPLCSNDDSGMLGGVGEGSPMAQMVPSPKVASSYAGSPMLPCSPQSPASSFDDICPEPDQLQLSTEESTFEYPFNTASHPEIKYPDTQGNGEGVFFSPERQALLNDVDDVLLSDLRQYFDTDVMADQSVCFPDISCSPLDAGNGFPFSSPEGLQSATSEVPYSALLDSSNLASPQLWNVPTQFPVVAALNGYQQVIPQMVSTSRPSSGVLAAPTTTTTTAYHGISHASPVIQTTARPILHPVRRQLSSQSCSYPARGMPVATDQQMNIVKEKRKERHILPSPLPANHTSYTSLSTAPDSPRNLGRNSTHNPAVVGVNDACCEYASVTPRTGATQRDKIMAERRVSELPHEQLRYVDKDDGDTLFHTAAVKGLDGLMHALLLRSKNEEMIDSVINVVNTSNQTAVHLATLANQSLIVGLLVAAGADVNVDARRHSASGRQLAAALHVAASKGDHWLLTVIELLRSPTVRVDKLNSNGDTALHCAVAAHGTQRNETQKPICCKQVIKHLVLCGASLTKEDGKSGRTPLHQACQKASPDLFAFLLCLLPPAKRADAVNRQMFDGNSCLHLAVGTPTNDKQQKMTLVQLLLSNGAAVSQRNAANRSPKDLANKDAVLINALHVKSSSTASKCTAAKGKRPAG